MGPSTGAPSVLVWHPWVVYAGEDPIDGAVILILLVVAIVSGFVASSIAQSKGLSGGGYFALGFFLPLIGILAAGFAVPIESGGLSPAGKRVHPLAELRSPDDPNVGSFLRDYQSKLNVALLRCEAGERVLAFGAGNWRSWKVVFLLTDRHFMFVNQMGGKTTIVDQLDEFTLDEKSGQMRSPDGALSPSSRSPFNAPELASLIRHRSQPSRYIEMIGPGELAPSRLSKSSEPATGTIDELERLDALRKGGAIDEAEFAELKRRLVWGDDKA